MASFARALPTKTRRVNVTLLQWYNRGAWVVNEAGRMARSRDPSLCSVSKIQAFVEHQFWHAVRCALRMRSRWKGAPRSIRGPNGRLRLLRARPRHQAG